MTVKTGSRGQQLCGPPAPDCSRPSCTKPAKTVGLCTMHYTRLRRHGDPDVVKVIHGNDLLRFESRVDRSAGTDECHPWTGGAAFAGYGGNITYVGKMYRPHVIAWMVANNASQPPAGKHVDHECHNAAVRAGTCSPGICRHRLCCNPLHLVARSPGDHNGATSPIPHATGAANANTKLSADQVIQIKTALAAGESIASIARQFAMSNGAIWHIKDGRNWKHIELPDALEVPQ